MIAEGAGEGGADVILRGGLGEELEEDEVGVEVGDDAGELVGFGEDEAGGVVFVTGGGELVAQGEGCGGALGDVFEVGFAGEGRKVRDEAQRDLRGGGEDGGAERGAAGVKDGDEGTGGDVGAAGCGAELGDVGAVDPEVAGAEAVARRGG